MTVVTRFIEVVTEGSGGISNLSEAVAKEVATSGLRSGVVTLFCTGSTAALSTMEFSEGLCKDFSATLERLVPSYIAYSHDKSWEGDHGHTRLQASLLGPSLAVPFIDGELALGSWQHIVLVERGGQRRKRKIVLQLIGE